MSSPLRCNGTALVLFGSETGNSQDVAGELERMASRLRFSTCTFPLNLVDVSTLTRYDIVLAAVSTTGQGELPRNARAFWKTILKKSLPSTYFQNVRIAIFGLGDSSYPKYNCAALKLHKRLLQLGAVDILAPGHGDEQHATGYDGTFSPWLNSLKRSLMESFPSNAGLEPLPDDVLLEPQWLLSLQEGSDTKYHNLVHTDARDKVESRASPREDGAKWLHVVLEKNERVTPVTHWQDVRHLTLTTKESVPYFPGDLITVYPKNTKEDVEELLSLMDWGSVAEKSVLFVRNKKCAAAPTTVPPLFDTIGTSSSMSLRKMITDHLDLNAIPRRHFFGILAHFSTDEAQRNRLVEFSKPDFVDELYDYTTRPRRRTLEVLQEFHTVKIPWQWAAVVLPELRGRQFSIASGGELKASTDNLSTRFELLVAIVKYRTVIRKVRRGVCTRYLDGLPIGSRLLVLLHRGSLGINQADVARPAVMIGPGTGVAPMRSLIWERQAWNDELEWIAAKQSRVSKEQLSGRTVLFFGGRNESADYFFRHEWERLGKAAPLHVFAAFSRDQEEKIYVQDLIRVQGQLVYHLLGEANGMVYVCGSSGKMPLAVRRALIEVFQTFGNMERSNAESCLSIMEKEGRYKQETW